MQSPHYWIPKWTSSNWSTSKLCTGHKPVLHRSRRNKSLWPTLTLRFLQRLHPFLDFRCGLREQVSILDESASTPSLQDIQCRVALCIPAASSNAGRIRLVEGEGGRLSTGQEFYAKVRVNFAIGLHGAHIPVRFFVCKCYTKGFSRKMCWWV